MTLLTWCFCLCFLAVVGSEDLSENLPPVEITNVKFLPYQKLELPGLAELAKKFVGASEKEQVAIINEYIDDVLYNTNNFLVEQKVDPAQLPGFEESFKWTVFKGWVSLDDGWLRGLSTIERRGDVTVKYEYPNVKLHMVLGFSKLAFDYHYEAKFMGLGPEGSADGEAKGTKFTVDLQMNMVTLRAKLDKFKLNTLGKLSLQFSGSAVASIANVLISVVLPILKPIINLVLNDVIGNGLATMIAFYNNFICTLLADCPEQVANIVYQQLR